MTAARGEELQAHEQAVRLIGNPSCPQDHALVACYRVVCRSCRATLVEHAPVQEIRAVIATASAGHDCAARA